MKCETFLNHVDAWAAGEPVAVPEQELQEHASRCKRCAQALEMAALIQHELQSDAVPEPSAGFEQRVLTQATARPGAYRVVRALPVWGGAIAATLVVGIWIGQGQDTPAQSPELAETSVDHREPAPVVFEPVQQTVKLAFNSKTDVENVTLTLELPPNVELSPFPGRHTISWTVNLKQGDNLLALPLNVLFPGQGELVAHLDDGETRKTFRTEIGLRRGPST